MRADLAQGRFEYPEGLSVGHGGVLDVGLPENSVVFECVSRLLDKGYPPRAIVLEPRWQVGHGSSGGRADIQVKDESGSSFLIIECKTFGTEFDKEWAATQAGSGQLFTYAHQESSTKWVALYASEWRNGEMNSILHLISVMDNAEYLDAHQERGGLLATFASATDSVERWRAWKETYQADYSTFGLFESGVQPYHPGLSRKAVDLSPVGSADTSKTFHTFANIMRQHNVSGRENAFDKLVNLLLAKIVDEMESADQLQFYWRGAAFDSPFDLQDRLGKLYAQGMKKFLNEDVEYVEESEIRSAFKLFKQDPDATREAVLEVFKKLKYFTNSDLAFIEVHNRRLFGQNSEILIAVVRMLQDLKLRTREHNQFLGDLFEGFLDQGVRQSEGQFFTPIPIVRFLVTALPSKALFEKQGRPLRVIDYACGAGHFLNEYAANLIRTGAVSQEDLPLHNREIIGVEKEYRLSKVAKVSSFMYGQDDIQIVYADALATPPPGSPIEDASFDVLVANPPYSVRGFLETLSPADRRRFELSRHVHEKSLAAVNSIEAFFIERAAQLLAPGGVAAIVLPISVLTTSTRLAISTRVLLLERFQIIALVELGPDTFGKTPTSTVTAFLRRREEPPRRGSHARNRVKAWFSADSSKDVVFDDASVVDKYCARIGADPTKYRAFMTEGRVAPELFDLPLFADLRGRYTKASSKSKKNTGQDPCQDDRVPSGLLAALRAEEMERMALFLLADDNGGPVTVIRSPRDASSRKAFLGYEWSSARGNEGIHYLGAGVPVDPDDVTPPSLGIMGIKTPMFDPSDVDSSSKLNTVIRDAFGGTYRDAEGVERNSLTDMLELTSPKLTLTVSLSPSRSSGTEDASGEWGMPLARVATTSSGLTVNKSETAPTGEVRVVRITDIASDGTLKREGGVYVSTAQAAGSVRLSAGDILISRTGESAGKFVIISDSDLEAGPMVFASYLIKVGVDEVRMRPEFLWYFMHSEKYQAQVSSLRHGASQPQFPAGKILQLRVPSLEIQEQDEIVQACRVSLDHVRSAEAALDGLLLDFEASSEWPLQPLREVCTLDAVRSIDDSLNYLGLEGIDPLTGEVRMDKPKAGTTAVSFDQRHVLWSKLRPNLRKVGLPQGAGRGSTEIQPLLPTDRVTREYLFFLLRSKAVLSAAVSASGGVRMPRAAIDRLWNVLVPVPTLDQQRLVTESLMQRLDEVRIQRAAVREGWAAVSGQFSGLV